jgi:hypothetical protein
MGNGQLQRGRPIDVVRVAKHVYGLKNSPKPAHVRYDAAVPDFMTSSLAKFQREARRG